MKTIILSILFVGLSAVASEPVQIPSDGASVGLNCDHLVPGTTCPSKYAAGDCKRLLCDSLPKDGAMTPVEKGTK
jgi:hypothetical protein